MDYEKYVHDLTQQLQMMEHSDMFKAYPKRYLPVNTDDVEEMEKEIAEEIEGFRIWEPIKRFFQHVVGAGFEWGWQYLGHTDPNRITCGTARISMIYQIYDPEDEIGQPFDLLYKNYRLLDRIGEESCVSLKFHKGKEEPYLYYYLKETDQYYPMSIGIIEYFELLLQTMGMYPWQEFFIADNDFKGDTQRQDQFLSDMELLFPQAETSLFVQ
jgi:hypothetical protein